MPDETIADTVSYESNKEGEKFSCGTMVYFQQSTSTPSPSSTSSAGNTTETIDTSSSNSAVYTYTSPLLTNHEQHI